MFVKNCDRDSIPHLEGIKYKTLTFGDRTSLSEFSLDKGSVIPKHSHPHEQTGYVIEVFSPAREDYLP